MIEMSALASIVLALFAWIKIDLTRIENKLDKHLKCHPEAKL